MLGIPDFWVWSAYVFCLLSVVLCVVYGVVNWNKDSGDGLQQDKENAKWEEEEDTIKANI